MKWITTKKREELKLGYSLHFSFKYTMRWTETRYFLGIRFYKRTVLKLEGYADSMSEAEREIEDVRQSGYNGINNV